MLQSDEDQFRTADLSGRDREMSQVSARTNRGNAIFSTGTPFRVLLLSLASITSASSAEEGFEAKRNRMVDTAIVAEGISGPAVLSAMRKVPRHEFVAAPFRAQAYEDHSLPIGAQQTISPPFVVAYMTEVLDPQPGDRILEIGTGSGYQAAVLAEICQEVYTIEIVPSLARSAQRRLKELGYQNVHVRAGDGYLGWPEHAPFDRIIVTCSPEQIPLPLTEQLKEGGTMLIPVGERYQQSFHLLKKKDGQLETQKLASTLFVPMTGESEKLRTILPDPMNPVIRNGSFEIDANGDGRADSWHYQRKAEICEENQSEPVNHFLRFKNEVPGELAQALQGNAVNGQKVSSLRITFRVRTENIQPGPEKGDQAGFVFHFYDRNRKEVGTVLHGRLPVSREWQHSVARVAVPTTSREMIVRAGLNGAVGVFDIDDVQLETTLR